MIQSWLCLTKESDKLEESELTLSQKAHVAQRSVKKILNLSSKSLVGCSFGVIVIIILSSSLISFIDNFGQWEWHLGSMDGPICAGHTGNQNCSHYFVQNTELDPYDIQLVVIVIWGIVLISGLLVSVFILFFFSWRPKIKNVKNQLDEIENDYLEENYGVTFNTTIPKGRTKGEKIFNMSQKVFPELKKIDGSEDVWKGTNKGHNGYTFDCYQTTNEDHKDDNEIFVVKHFGKELITLEKLQELCDECKESKSRIIDDNNRPIFRLICVGKNYDQSLLNNEYIENTLAEIDFEFPLDLILDDGTSYRVLWVDFE